jgi:prolyl 4-hydroxylase
MASEPDNSWSLASVVLEFALSADSRSTHTLKMSSDQSSIRWRTILEFTFIASVIYFFFGAPGLDRAKDTVAPKLLLRPDALVYPNEDLDCAEHKYDVHIFSAKPLIIYIDGFLSDEEADSLVELR